MWGGGAYTWSNTSVKEKMGLSAGSLYAGAPIRGGGGGGLKAEKYGIPQITKSYDHLQKLTYFWTPPSFHKNCSILTKLKSLTNYTAQLSKSILSLSFC